MKNLSHSNWKVHKMTFENQKQKLRKTNVYRLTRITNIDQGSGFEISGVYGGMGKVYYKGLW